ncbi:MAG: tryptophan synthase subunit alpha [Thermoanaerobaculia bacterium]|nr:tryptophan synthase subunit alpha [Thermoanaerobaculia bacterium]
MTSGKAKRIDDLFRRLRKERRCGFIAYVTCGDPSIDATVEIIRAVAEAGADAIELGVPFSDPIADGPTIQAASQRALAHGTTLGHCLDVARRVREKTDIPLILFSYLNPLMRYGFDRLAKDAAESGVDSILVTDLPPEDATDLRKAMKGEGLGIVFLLAPTSSKKRISSVDKASTSFIYYVSTTGVTGARNDLDSSLLERLDEIRESVRKPLAVGFGVSKHEHYRMLAGRCSAVVVGSAIVRAIDDGGAEGAADRAASVVRSIVDGERDAAG